MIYEIRWYEARPGRRDELVALMDQKVIPFMESFGIVVVGSYRDVHNEAGYVWIRRFDDEAHAASRTAEAYGNHRWTDELHDAVLQLMDPHHAVITKVESSAGSRIA